MNLLQNTASKTVSRIKTFIEEFGKVEILFFFIVMGLIYYTHSHNMFNYPGFENDEGVYMSQAWSITNLNKLAPYTYWYDHAPLGSMVLALFSQILGGYNRFGDAVSTGRVIMLIMHIVSSFMIIITTKKMTNNIWAGYAAAIMFSSLPLISYFQRRVLLDNILIFFFTFSLYFIVDKKINMTKIMLSGLFLGFAFLSKESGIFFIPGLLYLVITSLDKKQKVWGAIIWLGFFISTASMYIILALFKTELMPSSDKVSLIGTLQFMSARGNGIQFWKEGSHFRENIGIWIEKDFSSYYFLVFIFIIGVIWSLFKLKNKFWVTTIILLFGYLSFLLRGKIVIEFYIIPLSYILSLLFGLIFNEVTTLTSGFEFKIKFRNLSNQVLIIFILVLSIILQFKINSVALNNDDVKPSKDLINWVRKNLDKNSKIIIECNMYGDFHYPEESQPIFKDADWFWKADFDREVKEWKYQNNPNNVDYILVTSSFMNTLNAESLPFTKLVVERSKEIKRFNNEYTNASILQVIKNKPEILYNSWTEYKKKYLANSAIRSNTNFLTSSDQKYGMMQSLINNDKASFDSIWNFTKDNFQKRKADKLLVSKIRNIDGATTILNSNSSSDAETEITLSLILATNKWNDVQYSNDAKDILNDLFKLRVANQNGNSVLLQSDSNITQGYDLIHMSQLSPGHFRIFNSVNPENNWLKLSEDSYSILNQVMQTRTLIPNWVKYNYITKQYEDATDQKGPSSNQFTTETSNIFWRLNLDTQLTQKQSPISETVLKKQKEFFEKEFDQNKSIKTVYGIDGTRQSEKESTTMDAGIYSLLSFTDSKIKGEYFRSKFIEKIDLDTQTFDNQGSFEDQSLGPIVFALKEGYIKELDNYIVK